MVRMLLAVLFKELFASIPVANAFTTQGQFALLTLPSDLRFFGAVVALCGWFDFGKSLHPLHELHSDGLLDVLVVMAGIACVAHVHVAFHTVKHVLVVSDS